MRLEVSNLTYRFPDTGRGCTGISFIARKGDLTVLVAPSGFGKSTALAATAGILTPQAGKVLLNGNYLAPGRSALILQTAQVFEMLKAWENVACAWGVPSKKLRAMAIRELRRYGLAEVAESFPNQLSGGQRQRLAIVSALAQGNELLLADEVTSHLDETNANLVIGLLKDAAQDKIVVVASHDDRLARAADCVVYLEEGERLE